MTLTVYNSRTRQLEPLEPERDSIITMYVCGVTVYDFCHLGHARTYVVWDVVRRYLEHLEYDVHHVQNITDIDDKILKKAQAENVEMGHITEQYIKAYNEDMTRLNILPAQQYPRATESISDMIQLIQSLESLGYAYAVAGDVYYAVERFPRYGNLSHRNLEQMQSGASGRVDKEAKIKRHPLDFALWKSAKPGEPAWDSPWGPGRPGWHIECSAMVHKTLGASIDIHAGGSDLIFPHHENEIAQSEPITQKPLARYWLHNGFVTVDGEKMSKSLGNFRTIRDVLNHYEPMALRLLILQSHYRQPIECTPTALNAAQSGWQTLQQGAGVYDLQELATLNKTDCDPEILAQFEHGMDADFNTPIALAILFGLAKKLKRIDHKQYYSDKTHIPEGSYQLWQTFVYLAQNVLGLKFTPPAPITATTIDEDRATIQLFSDEIQELIRRRQQARQTKNYREADRIRQELTEKGFQIIDQPNGETLIVEQTR
ncbi:cysteinyl-tRNA synthetase [Gloeomargarita lithophora Alchichica-D10]|uniref:Cysteine--tRNA ligase n=1 Tax=Gloeomargarita lithophora Alchichica-D10 TaxID=1188229 RepID=A0A1J0A964_9CYAN|nr:cysteine--tRNA ligase [Gloeomargarita lithophora]APB32449.1 cysteinyl-tRNA synthetase [Gloeomargarita lithophora Alchichica-D10]